jgi:hypothetical protein
MVFWTWGILCIYGQSSAGDVSSGVLVIHQVGVIYLGIGGFQELSILRHEWELGMGKAYAAITNCTKPSTLKTIEEIVKSAARLGLNRRRSDPVLEELTESLRWLMSKFLYQKSLVCICTIHKLINSSRSPEYFRKQSTYNSEIHRHNTRLRDEMHILIQPKSKHGIKGVHS